MDRRGRVVLFGLGPWGRNLHRVIDDLGELRGAFDVDPRALAFTRPELRYASVTDALADPKVEAVAIATPAAAHFDLAKAALLAGKDVFVEKPLCLDPAEGAELSDLADRFGRVLMTGHVTVYHPAVLALRDALRRGDLGAPRYVYSNRLNLGVVRETENILWSFAPHDFAVMTYLLDDAPFEIQAVGSSHLRADRADVTVTHLKFPRGVRGHIFVSWLHPMREHRLVVIGDRRMATFVDDGRGGALTVFDTGVDEAGGKLVHRRDAGQAVPLPTQEPLRLELAHFLECCDRREEPLTGGRHGLEVVRMLAAADQSLRSGGVAVPFESTARRPR